MEPKGNLSHHHTLTTSTPSKSTQVNEIGPTVVATRDVIYMRPKECVQLQSTCLQRRDPYDATHATYSATSRDTNPTWKSMTTQPRKGYLDT